MDTIIAILSFVILLSVIVFVHELGHFLTAKAFGVYCGEFSIGMGPVLFKKQVGETQYSIRALPIGGFVSMAGEADDTKADENVPFERTINGIKTYQQVIVMLAGIIMNVILAWVVFVGINMAVGQRVEAQPAIINEVVSDSIASQAGFEVGDKVTRIEDTENNVYDITTASEMVSVVNTFEGELTFTVERDGKTLQLSATPILDTESDSKRIGVAFAPGKVIKISPMDAIGYGTQDLKEASTAVFDGLANLLHGKNLTQLSGPVGIFKISAQAAQSGILVFLRLLALFSVNIGIMNALPIPALDGGRVIIVLAERLFGRKLNEKVMNGLILGGFAVLVGLMLFATYNDILRMF
ncbi:MULTISPECIES: RIP metalloprotease RseP [unclassified Breznakia]|uniref:RIP metalloprotease RseP n=1 Tax=unclassified Breznakia TaxID=2623764 RepID=UPI002475B90D|nr:MULTISPECIES: RIP metalloprotease RseP [unclassified Breznakia]MDH6366740.1 regulator of sigma E protease [Breznakia sp. PH1-1]MDH6403873.1 regulator of sigma E protease [Breznakia sp. PF1-11]MDH6411582.1 regulator of sigma E protease [Breznakia sp. PFB1-11]MDH6413946.1 regulator of sigma E protease [Breznakia sp. PFB1-14]MDH6416375.1 regulator of sigma E protease [Breznakia sp. PFB1-4]